MISISSENLEISECAFDSDVPPLNKRRGSFAFRLLKSRSKTQQIQKSFSILPRGTPKGFAEAKYINLFPLQ